MRSRSWFSAAAAVLAAVLAGCGGSGRPSAFPDPGGPIDFTGHVVAQNSSSRLERVSFRGAGGKTVEGLLAVSRRSGPRPAVVFLTGSGGLMTDLAPSVIDFANRGGVGLSIQQPADASTWAPYVENVRRALDLLAARSDVDPKRLGIAGLSLGAETAAIVAGVDPRPRAIALMSCRGRHVVLDYLHYARGASFYVQDGDLDTVVPRHQLVLTIRALRALHRPLRVTWYPDGHLLEDAAYKSQVDWLLSKLR
jgi:dienelactone hydrolase